MVYQMGKRKVVESDMRNPLQIIFMLSRNLRRVRDDTGKTPLQMPYPAAYQTKVASEDVAAKKSATPC